MSGKHIQYTGFTTRCRYCGVEVEVEYIGKTKDGVASYKIKCKCKEKCKEK